MALSHPFSFDFMVSISGNSIVLVTGSLGGSGWIAESGTSDHQLSVGEIVTVLISGDAYDDSFVGWYAQGGNAAVVTTDGNYHYVYANFDIFPLVLAGPVAFNTTPMPLSVLPCFLEGTLVKTERGDVAVEDLEPGDRLLTLSGEFAPLRWIGHRAVTERRIATDPIKALPICFAAGSLGGGLPARDLWLSPDHCLHHDGVLVQAKHLVNGTTVTQTHPGQPITYYHLLMDRHEVIFAEGAESETYRPCGNVMAFTNAGDFPADIELNQPRSSSRYPVKKSGARFEALKAAIAAEADAAGARTTENRAA